jgi:UTP--glucose-1-phosphate uridylyltransferase
VTGWTKRSIEDHFDYPFELEKRLEESGKHQELEEIRKIANLANFYFVRQKGPLGNATPIWNARDFIGDEPFVVLWGDDFIAAEPSRCKQLVASFEQNKASAILGSIRMNNPEDYRRYGYAEGAEVSPGLLKIDQVVEKPGAGRIKSDYAVVSGAVYGPEMFGAIEEAMRRKEQENTPGELVYLDAVKILLEQKKPCFALEIKNGKYYDCGNKLDYLKTVVEFGLKHEDLKEEFGEYLRSLKN